MAAPPSKTLKDLSGKWYMNKTLSDSPEPGLALQGIGWLTRKAIGLSSITLHVKQYVGPPKPPSTATDTVTHIDIDQTATGGVKGTSEHRCVDGFVRDHSDYLFGAVKSRSVWIAADKIDDVDVVDDENKHLSSGWEEGEEEKSGPEGETHVWSRAESVDGGWTATQVWGFQLIGGERRYCRNVLIQKGEEKAEFRLVYDWLGEEEGSADS